MAGNKWDFLDGPLREAFVAKSRPSEVLRAIRAGTLPGVGQPTPISDRAFFERWKKAGRAVRQEDRAGADRLAAARKETELTDALLAEGLGDEEIAERLIAEDREPTEHRLELYAHSVRSRRDQLLTADLERTLNP